jgi:hypothetical protein
MKTISYTHFSDLKDLKGYFICQYCHQEDFWFIGWKNEIAYYTCLNKKHDYCGATKSDRPKKHLVRVINSSPLQILAKRFA